MCFRDLRYRLDLNEVIKASGKTANVIYLAAHLEKYCRHACVCAHALGRPSARPCVCVRALSVLLRTSGTQRSREKALRQQGSANYLWGEALAGARSAAARACGDTLLHQRAIIYGAWFTRLNSSAACCSRFQIIKSLYNIKISDDRKGNDRYANYAVTMQLLKIYIKYCVKVSGRKLRLMIFMVV